VVHGSAEVEIFDVHRDELGARGGDDTVEEKLSGGKAGRFGADVSGVVDSVAANGEADTAGLGFLGAVRDDKAQVRGFAAGGHGSDGDEEEGVGTFGFRDATGGETLGKASDFFGAAAFPEVAVRALEERLVLNGFTRVHMERSMRGMRGVIADGGGVGGA
jgi:hypothetical protein